jgi:hypothetical protein
MDYSNTDPSILEKLRQTEEFNLLEREHEGIKKWLREMESRKHLTPEEEVEVKDYKKRKLIIKETIIKMVDQEKAWRKNSGSEL